MISAARPSQNQPWSASGLRSANGRMATAAMGENGAGGDAAGVAPVACAAGVRTTLRPRMSKIQASTATGTTPAAAARISQRLPASGSSPSGSNTTSPTCSSTHATTM